MSALRPMGCKAITCSGCLATSSVSVRSNGICVLAYQHMLPSAWATLGEALWPRVGLLRCGAISRVLSSPFCGIPTCIHERWHGTRFSYAGPS